MPPQQLAAPSRTARRAFWYSSRWRTRGGAIAAGGPDGQVRVEPAAATFYGIATKQGFAASFHPADAGKRAHYYGPCVNARGQMGPFSAAVSLGVAA
jgi:hypothetical protein